MGLNIKNEETHKLVRELASLTGESMTEAIGQAVRERIDRVKREQTVGLSAQLLAIGKDCARHMKEPFLTVDHGTLLYGEDGLPR
jgi:antitoxin VapB